MAPPCGLPPLELLRQPGQRRWVPSREDAFPLSRQRRQGVVRIAHDTAEMSHSQLNDKATPFDRAREGVISPHGSGPRARRYSRHYVRHVVRTLRDASAAGGMGTEFFLWLRQSHNVVSIRPLVVSGRVVSRLIKSGPVKAGSSCAASRRGISRPAKGHPCENSTP